ncbi:MAG: PQQ-dependent sugar dehydrogenase [Phycisphaeraceae bacterium]
MTAPLYAAPAEQGQRGPGVPAFTVRPGYRVTLAAERVGEGRFIEFDDKGTLYLAGIRNGKVWAWKDKDGDGVYETETLFLENQRHVHGLCWYDGWLWFAPSTAVGKARDTNGDGKADDVEIVLKDLPGGSGHLWRSLLVTKDGLWTSVGDPGNITDQTDTDREKIWFYQHDGSGKKLWSSGLRNTEKLRMRPGTTEIWGAEHGSDWFGGPLGDKAGRQPITDLWPPDEFNHYVEGGFYGHPFLVGPRVPRVESQKRPDLIDLAAKTIAPGWMFGAHWATNGFGFVSNENKMFPPDHRGDAFVGCHGSWNSQTRVGYRVERVMFDKWTGKPFGSQMIVSTLNAQAPGSDDVLGRPVDCAEAPDGSILFTVDAPGARIYRISWVGEKTE